MKTNILMPREVNITHIRLAIAVRYEEEDIPNDFPLRKGDMWTAVVNIDTGQIENWPTQTIDRNLHMKVCDQGTYTLMDENGSTVAEIESDYVPNRIVPGSYGDYVDLRIDKNGVITNWPKKPDVSQFFGSDDD